MMEHTLYFHIGTPKTGTTAIQSFLYKNRQWLWDQGVEYIKLCENESPDVGNGAVFCNADYSLADISYSNDITGKIKNALKCRNVIISKENFWQSPTFPLWLESWMGEVQNVKVIVYLRRQDLFIESFWNEIIKEGCYSDDFDTFFNKIKSEDYIVYGPHKMNTRVFSYLEVLDSIAQSIGKENIIVRPFEKQQFYNEELISDFVRILGISKLDGSCLPERINDRLFGDILEIQRLINLGQKDSAKKYNSSSYREILERVNCEYLAKYPEKRKEGYFSQSDRIEYINSLSKENEEIARKYLMREDGILFADEVKEVPLHKTLQSSETEYLIVLLSSLVNCTVKDDISPKQYKVKKKIKNFCRSLYKKIKMGRQRH